MVRRVAVALGLARAPRWVGTIVDEVLAAYVAAPADRPRELALFVGTTQGWERMGAPQHVVRRQPRATTVVRDRFGVAPLPDAAALGRLLDLDSAELAWFADVRGWSAPSTSRYGTTGGTRSSGAAVCGCSAPSSTPGRRCPGPSGTRCARCCTPAPGTAGPPRPAGTTRRPSASTSSAGWPGPPLDPVLGARLHALAREVDWG